MAHLIDPATAELLLLRGRSARVLVAGEESGDSLTVRLVTVEPEMPDAEPRPLHLHEKFCEFIYILSGSGLLHSPTGTSEAHAGQAVYVAAGEWHKLEPQGGKPLELLCVFPTANVATGSREQDG